MQKDLTYNGLDIVGDFHCDLRATGEKDVHFCVVPSSMNLYVENEPGRYERITNLQDFYDLRPEIDGEPVYLTLNDDSYDHHLDEYDKNDNDKNTYDSVNTKYEDEEKFEEGIEKDDLDEPDSLELDDDDDYDYSEDLE